MLVTAAIVFTYYTVWAMVLVRICFNIRSLLC